MLHVLRAATRTKPAGPEGTRSGRSGAQGSRAPGRIAKTLRRGAVRHAPRGTIGPHRDAGSSRRDPQDPRDPRRGRPTQEPRATGVDLGSAHERRTLSATALRYGNVTPGRGRSERGRARRPSSLLAPCRVSKAYLAAPCGMTRVRVPLGRLGDLRTRMIPLTFEAPRPGTQSRVKRDRPARARLGTLVTLTRHARKVQKAAPPSQRSSRSLGHGSERWPPQPRGRNGAPHRGPKRSRRVR
jgi:hypothetical protein